MTILNVQLLSDIHFEDHRDGGKSFINSLNPIGKDVLVLAGDIVTLNSIGSLDLLCEKYKDVKVIWVHGNHTFYGNDRPSVVAASKAAVERNHNLVWLDNNCFKYKGVRFVGTPLWFPMSTDTALFSKDWNEFDRIPHWHTWVYMEHEAARTFLYKTVEKSDVVITHYLPTYKSVSENWRGSPTNCFFIGDQENVIGDHEPRLWLHGHTHDSKDYNLFNTRIVCNPFGYVSERINKYFNYDLIIKVDNE